MDVAVLVSESQLHVVIFNDVANHQNRGVQTHLSHNNLNTLRGVNLAAETPTREFQNLVLISVLQRVVAQVGSELIRSGNRVLTDAITRLRTSRCSCSRICSSVLGKRWRHWQNHRAGQRQCAASLRRTEERRLRVRKSGHKYSLSVMSIAPMQVLNGGEKFPSNLRWPKEKVVEYPRRFRGYSHPTKPSMRSPENAQGTIKSPEILCLNDPAST